MDHLVMLDNIITLVKSNAHTAMQTEELTNYREKQDLS